MGKIKNNYFKKIQLIFHALVSFYFVYKIVKFINPCILTYFIH